MEESHMSKSEESAEITPEMMAELQEAIERAMKGIRDPEAMRKACDRMDRMREETYRKHGLLDIAVPSIRALRDGDDE
jgi:benzoyl-CoA reductase/2-hydroxyglutaryl-CoA dehydratase subunit BcrC/BadD/HgdB